MLNCQKERVRETLKQEKNFELSHIGNTERGKHDCLHAHVAQYHTLVTCICSISIWLLGFYDMDFSSWLPVLNIVLDKSIGNDLQMVTWREHDDDSRIQKDWITPFSLVIEILFFINTIFRLICIPAKKGQRISFYVFYVFNSWSYVCGLNG